MPRAGPGSWRPPFGANQALQGVSLEVEAGTIHGIVGPNGAGKSTLLKILTGQLDPDSGTIKINLVKIEDLSPRRALMHGLAIVPQETSLSETLTVAEMIVLGREPTRGGLLTSRAAAERVAAVCLAEMNLDLPLRTRVSELSASARRLVMFAQVVFRKARVIIVDEPTAGLDEHDAGIVVAELAKLRSSDRAIIFVSHRLTEVVELCDSATAIRDGRVAATIDRAAMTKASLSDLILGAKTQEYARRPHQDRATKAVVLRCESLSGDILRDVSLDLHEGEILGIAGLVESGVEELASVLAGDCRQTRGNISVDGRVVQLRSPADAMDAGISNIPEDRTRALLLDSAVRSNVAIPRWRFISQWGLLASRYERDFVRGVLERLNLMRHCDSPVVALSGGNRQKVLLARAVATGARILVIGNPTAGVDIMGTAEIHAEVNNLVAENYSVVLSSSEPEELAGLCDRVLVMSRGIVVNELSGSGLSADQIVRAMQ